jgi:hypothetical protein
MKKNVFGLILIALIILIAIAIIFLNTPKKEVVYDETIPPEKIKLNEKQIPFGPLTSIIIEENRLSFAYNDNNIIELNVWDGINLTEGNKLIIGERLYEVQAFDAEKHVFSLLAEETLFAEEEIITKNFELGKISEIKFKDIYGKPINYFFVVFKDIAPDTKEEFYRLNVFLAENAFPLQFGKTLYFAGTDTDEDKKINEKYYVKDSTDFGFNANDSKHLIAHFYVDEEGNKNYNIKFYFDTAINSLIQKEINGYNFMVEAITNNKTIGLKPKEQKTIYTVFGTQITTEGSERVIIRIPKE